MKTSIYLIIALVFGCFLGCKQTGEESAKETDGKNVFADKVVYEVNLTKDEDRPSWLEKLDNKKLVDYLIDNAVSGKLKAYDYFTNQYLSPKEIKKLVESRTDTTYINNAETGLGQIKTTRIEFDRADIKSLVFIEKWFVDTDNSKFKKKVQGIGLVKHFYKKAESEDMKEKLCKDLLFVVEVKAN